MIEHIYDPGNLWERYKKSFIIRIKSVDHKTLRNTWDSQTNRTTFYSNYVMRNVAADLEMKLEEQLLQIDYALSVRTQDGTLVPVIFIESENVARTSIHEISKLCSVNTPLRVLVTVCEWDLSPEAWGTKSLQNTLLQGWRQIIENYRGVYSQNAIVGVLIGEWWDRESRLRFYSHTFDLSKSEERDESYVFETFVK